MSIIASIIRPLGFFGQAGFLYFFLGLILTAIVIAILFKILKLALPALGVTEPWVQIITWVLVLFCVIFFFNYSFGGWF